MANSSHVSLLLTIFLAVSTFEMASGQTPRPNVLILVVDDLRADAVGEIGNKAFNTPHLDEIVRSGFVFRNAYSGGASQPEICSCGRHSLLSGRSHFHPCAEDPQGLTTLPDFFKAIGYRTFYHGCEGAATHVLEDRFEENHALDESAKTLKIEAQGKATVDEALRFLTAKSSSVNKPFLMCLGFDASGSRSEGGQGGLSAVKGSSVLLPKNVMMQPLFDTEGHANSSASADSLPRSSKAIERVWHDYVEVISALDVQIGRLVETLREKRQFDNTILVFTSSNGICLGSHGYMGKQNLYDESVRVPLVVSGPGIPRGSTEALATLMDVFPTLVEFSGEKPAQQIDGHSLRSVILGLSSSVRMSAFMAYRDSQRAVRDARWKLILYPKLGRTELFDLNADPLEMNDLSSDAAHGTRIILMTDWIRQWQRQLGDTVPLKPSAKDGQVLASPMRTSP